MAFQSEKENIYFNIPNTLPTPNNNEEIDIEYMSGEEYIKQCARLQGTSVQEQYKFIDKNNVDKIKNQMENGIKFNIGYLNYVKNTQEGRHRVIAASELGQTKIPVLVVKSIAKESQSLDSMLDNWFDLSKDKYGDFIVKYNLTDYNEEKMLLTAIRKDYDIYLLDNVLRKDFYPITNTTDINNINLSEFQSIIPNNNLNDNQLKTIIAKTIDTIIIEHNYKELSNILNVNNNVGMLLIDKNLNLSNLDNYPSAKKMLANEQIFNDLDLYSTESNEPYRIINKEKIQKTMQQSIKSPMDEIFKSLTSLQEELNIQNKVNIKQKNLLKIEKYLKTKRNNH